MLAIIDAVSVISKKHNATPGQVALAWLLEQGGDIIPIPGTKKQKAGIEWASLFLLADL